MNTAVGKPFLAVMAAGIIAVPASTSAASVETGRTFHPLPAELSVTAPVELTAFSYPSLFNLATAIGNAAFAGLDIVFLPLSVGYLAANLQSGAIPAYLAGVEKVVTGAIPGLEAALAAVFGGLGAAAVKPASVATTASTVSPNVVTSNVVTSKAAAVTPVVTPALSLGGIYTGLFNLATAIGNASFAGLQVVFLPLSVGFLVLNLQSSAVPAYLKSVATNLGAAIPGIIKALQALVGGVGSLAVKSAAIKPASVTSTVTPTATKLVTLSTVTPPTTSSTKLAGTKKKTTGGTHSTTSGTSAGKSK